MTGIDLCWIWGPSFRRVRVRVNLNGWHDEEEKIDECKCPRQLGVNRQVAFALKAHQGHESWGVMNSPSPTRERLRRGRVAHPF